MDKVRLKETRKTLGATQEEFAKLLGVKTRSVQSWESGERNIPQTAVFLLNRIVKEHNTISHEFNKHAKESVLEITRFLFENNNELMKNVVFREYIKSNIELLEIEKEEKSLEEKKKIAQNKIEKLLKNRKK